jgi:hypothetical protein
VNWTDVSIDKSRMMYADDLHLLDALDPFLCLLFWLSRKRSITVCIKWSNWVRPKNITQEKQLNIKIKTRVIDTRKIAMVVKAAPLSEPSSNALGAIDLGGDWLDVLPQSSTPT